MRALLIAMAGLCCAVAVACGGSSAEPLVSPTTTAGGSGVPATPTPEPSPAAPAPVHPPQTTGVAAIDAVVRAVLAKDIPSLTARLHFEPHACTGLEGPIPGGPICPAGRVLGTPLPAMLIYGCPGGQHARVDELPGAFENLLSARATLYAVAAVPGGSVVAFTVPGPGGTPTGLLRALSLNETGEISGLTFACPGTTSAQFMSTQAVASYLIPPR